MANIPLRDVPDLPSYDPTMPMPEGRVPDLPQLNQIRGKLENPFQFEEAAAKVRQPFKSDAGWQATASIAGSIMEFGQSLGKLGLQLDKAKQLADISRVDNDATNTWLAFNEQANKEGLQAPERYRRWTEEVGPELAQRVQGMGLSSYTQSEALPKLHTFIARKASDLSDDLYKYESARNETAIRTDMENKVAAGDKLGAMDANYRLTNAGLQTKEQEEKNERIITQKAVEYQMQVQMNIDPRPVLEEMNEAKLYGSSDVYPEVTDPALINNYQKVAQQAVNSMYVDAQNRIDNEIHEGRITNMEQVRSVAGGKLEPRHFEQYEKKLVGDPVHDPQVVEQIRTQIMKYDGSTDGRLEQFDGIHKEIVLRVPKHLQQILNNELVAQQSDTREGKLKPSQQKFLGEIYGQVDDLGKDGYFNAGHTGRDPKSPNKIVDWNTHLVNWGKTRDVKNHMEDFMHKNPNATTTEVREEIKKMVSGAESDWALQQRLQRAEAALEIRRQEIQIRGTAQEVEAEYRPGLTAPGAEINLKEQNELIPSGPLERKPIPQPKAAAEPAASKPTSRLAPEGKLKNVNPDLIARLDTLQQQFGKLKINSGYRDPAHNKAVGGARGSQHIHGNAVDIDVSDMSHKERLALIEAASQAGITGIGVYNTALHFDLAGRRAWGPNYHFASVPAWAKATINRHVAG